MMEGKYVGCIRIVFNEYYLIVIPICEITTIFGTLAKGIHICLGYTLFVISIFFFF